MLKTDLFRMRDAIDQYYADKGKYPASLDALVTDSTCATSPRIRSRKSKDTWQTVPAEPDPNNPTAEPGIYDVKSGAHRHSARRHELLGLVMTNAECRMPNAECRMRDAEMVKARKPLAGVRRPRLQPRRPAWTRAVPRRPATTPSACAPMANAGRM